jgi:hypothetical protein
VFGWVCIGCWASCAHRFTGIVRYFGADEHQGLLLLPQCTIKHISNFALSMTFLFELIVLDLSCTIRIAPMFFRRIV